MAVNKTSRKFTKWVCFLAYLLLLIYLLFFAVFMGRTGQSEEYRYNLTLFQEIMRYWGIVERTGSWNLFLWNVVGNIVVFMPFGIFVPMLFKSGKKMIYTVVLTLELSVVLEVMQLITKVGSFDVDDLLLNTLGGLCGYLLYMLCYLSGKAKRKLRK